MYNTDLRVNFYKYAHSKDILVDVLLEVPIYTKSFLDELTSVILKEYVHNYTGEKSVIDLNTWDILSSKDAINKPCIPLVYLISHITSYTRFHEIADEYEAKSQIDPIQLLDHIESTCNNSLIKEWVKSTPIENLKKWFLKDTDTIDRCKHIVEWGRTNSFSLPLNFEDGEVLKISTNSIKNAIENNFYKDYYILIQKEDLYEYNIELQCNISSNTFSFYKKEVNYA